MRQSLKLTQAQFGKKFGLSHQLISEIERGKSRPSKTLLAFLEFQYGENFGLEVPAGQDARRNTKPTAGYRQSPEHMLPRGRGDDADSDRGSYGLPDLEGQRVVQLHLPEDQSQDDADGTGGEIVDGALGDLEDIVRSDDPDVRSSLLNNFNALRFSSQLLRKYQDIRKRMDAIQATLESIKVAIQEEKPPEDMKERRRLWVRIGNLIDSKRDGSE